MNGSSVGVENYGKLFDKGKRWLVSGWIYKVFSLDFRYGFE